MFVVLGQEAAMRYRSLIGSFIGVMLFLVLAPCLNAQTTSPQDARWGFWRFVHYCNWFVKLPIFNNWPDAQSHPLYSDGFYLVPPNAPKGYDGFLGYHSLDKTTIAHHNQLFEENGLTPCISFWGREGGPLAFSGDEFLEMYLSVPSSVKVCILYEVVGLLKETKRQVGPGYFDFGDSIESENAQRFISDMKYFNERYFKRFPDRMATIDGRPVVFIWLSHAFTGRFDLAMAEARKSVDVYVIGSDFNILGPPDATNANFMSVMRGVDAVSAYGIYSTQLAAAHNGHTDFAVANQLAFAVKEWARWIREYFPGKKVLMPMQFTYNPPDPVASSASTVPATVQSMVRATRFASASSAPKVSMISTTPEEARYMLQKARDVIEEARNGCEEELLAGFIGVSLNENFEDTSWEPTSDYGDSFLKAAKDFGRPLPPIPAICTAR